ncbi:MAG TPA: glutamate--tRNA ligase [Acidimicrobiales bacterium]|nr:glutamate--tRNA ligase [Acidimicrobiales bacterium]
MVRVRFCPSPTGYFHVGGGRTALFNWLLVKRLGGEFILRIEDTDAERNKEEWVLGIHNAMRWLGLDWDEYYRQSERLELYRAAAGRLAADGKAYYCDCTREVVVERTKGNATPGYDSFCRDRGLEPGPGRALRFRTPDDGATTIVDVVRGEPTFEHSTIEDFVLQRGDGSPLFILANVVDDMDMRISHVVRSEEHLPNTPKYVLLWHALGGGEPAGSGGRTQLPVFAHLPVVVNEKRQKLSKRRPGDRVELEQYQEEGYLAVAMRNYLALLGWAPGDDREFVTVEEMIEAFRLEAVKSAPAFFDVKKLRHFNGHYIRELSAGDFVSAVGPYLQDAIPFVDYDVLEQIAPLVQERIEVLSDVPAMVDFLFLREPPIDEAAWDKHMKGNAAEILDGVLRLYAECEWTADAIKDATVAVGEGLGLSLTKAHFPVRVAVTGRAVGPPLFDALEVLGREPTLERLRSARDRLS